MVDCAKESTLCSQQGVQRGNYPHFWVYQRCHDAFMVHVQPEDASEDESKREEHLEAEAPDEAEREQQDGETSEGGDDERNADEELAQLECKTLKGKGEKLFSAHEIAPHMAMPLMAKLLRNSIPLPVRTHLCIALCISMLLRILLSLCCASL